MKHLNRIMPLLGVIAIWCSMTMVGCEDAGLYEVDSPDWITSAIDSIANAGGSTSSTDAEVLEGQMEDVYTFGETDYSSGFWTAFSKYYVIPDGEKWQAQFTLHINPDDNTYYKNFGLVITSDDDRSGSEGNGYTEYGVIRYDATTDSATYNSLWGSYIWFKYSSCNNYMSPVDNEDALLQEMNGTVTLTVDRSRVDTFYVCISNSSITKTYTYPYALPNLNSDATDTDIRCFVTPEGSYIDWISTNIEPVGGCTSANDKAPVSMVLENVPAQATIGASLEDLVADITATVTFEEDVTSTVSADDMSFTVTSGSLDELGTITLVAAYNQTYNGNTAETPIVASATIEVVSLITSLEVTAQPTYTTYYICSVEEIGAVARTFLTSGLEVTATYDDGTVTVIDNSYLTFTDVPGEAGEQTVTISCADGPTTEVTVTVVESTVTEVTNSESLVGAEDFSTAFWGAFTDDFTVDANTTSSISFTNYAGSGNWNNYVVILRNADYENENVEYAVVRADNYGWGNGYAACTLSGGQSDWSTWLADMYGAAVTVYVTNCGNGTADVQVVMTGTSGETYIQYYLGIDTVDPDDLTFALTVDVSYIVFE